MRGTFVVVDARSGGREQSFARDSVKRFGSTTLIGCYVEFVPDSTRHAAKNDGVHRRLIDDGRIE